MDSSHYQELTPTSSVLYTEGDSERFIAELRVKESTAESLDEAEQLALGAGGRVVEFSCLR